MLQISYHPKAWKEFLEIPKKFQHQILSRIEELHILEHPLEHPRVLKLKGRSTNDYRIRSGDYRIKFTFTKQRIVFITEIEHRQAGY